MNTADYVDSLVVQLKNNGTAIQDAVWETAKACVGWPYTFGARGGKTTKDGKTVRTFDCRGFTYWCLLQFGIKILGAGCTTQWNDDSNWLAKGEISNIPENTLVCLFYREKDAPNKMAHTGFGYHGETCECSSGVQYFKTRKSKWQYWAIPKGLTDKIPEPDPDYRPLLRRGDRGQYVTLAQTLLINKGYALPKYGADGDFGGETLAAVKAFQQDSGLNPDGVIGPQTWEALEGAAETTLYTVTIPHLTKTKADAIAGQYPGAVVTEERG